MTPCKFQTDASGKDGVLIYSEDRATVFAVAHGEYAEKIRASLDLPRRFGRGFAMAEVLPSGQIVIGERLPDQLW